MREIIVDNFAGSGGASTGIEQAIGRSVDIAINHDPLAIAMHRANHPDTKHYCESVWDVDPVEAVAGRPVGLGWFSPDCKHFSKAKGGKPVDQNIRGLAWVAVRWAETVRPRVIMLENVEEFKTWGPLKKNEKGELHPDPTRAGETFDLFIAKLRKLGYQVDHRELRACDYGAPTIRKRFFLVARCDGKPIVWPEITHGDPRSLEVMSGLLKPWKTAADVIDWSIPCPSIFKRKKPLAENTLKRIARGIQKFISENPDPFIVPGTHQSNDNSQMAAAFLSTYYGETASGGVRGATITEPIHTLTTANRHAVVVAFLTAYYGASVGSRCDDPLQTITTKDRFGLVVVKGQNFKIKDIGLRMLSARELYNAHSFPPDYIIDRDIDGNPVKKARQIAGVGNSVVVDIPKALVRANLPEMCGIEVETEQAV